MSPIRNVIQEIQSFTDLRMNVQVELDRRAMRLHDFLALENGSILTLPKPAGEPLDIFVGGVLLGSGEVIALNENFSVRLTAFAEDDTAPAMSSAFWTANHDSEWLKDVPLQSKDFNTLTLLLDQLVSVRVIVGRAALTLEKLLKLSTGSVLELESALKQPVEVTVNDRVLAFGEVVVVDGYYGVRIQSVVNRRSSFSAAERLVQPTAAQ